MLRKLVCWITLLAFPLPLLAADSGAAMLHTKGATWVNGAPAPTAAAVFPGDLVQTEGDSVASINSPGSSVSILPGSLVRFESSALGLDHGSVSVATSKRLVAKAGSVTVVPTSDQWTEFQVSENNGDVRVVAQKGDVSVADDSGNATTVPAGQQTTKHSSSKDRKRDGAAPAAAGGILDSPIVVGVGGAAVGALVTWVIMQGGKPFSPKGP